MVGERVCVIGAGSSGIVACQVLSARGIPFDCFEKGSAVGGNWRFENDNGMSSAYRSLHINTSRRVMAFKTLPMPDHYPDYPDHFQMADYFDEYVDHFGLRDKISFRTAVLSVEPRDGGWEVTIEDDDGQRETRQYRAVMVANGHHWDPRWPEPAFPGAEEFAGEQLHAHHYREPDTLRGKRVLVLGIGNSAIDIAVESSRIAEKTFLATRRGAYVMPKYINGKPIDERLEPDHLDAAPVGAAVLRHAARSASPPPPTRPPTGCPSPTTSCSRRTRPSPRSCCRASVTATSRSSPTSTASPAAARSASSTAARRRSTSSSTAPATR